MVLLRKCHDAAAGSEVLLESKAIRESRREVCRMAGGFVSQANAIKVLLNTCCTCHLFLRQLCLSIALDDHAIFTLLACKHSPVQSQHGCRLIVECDAARSIWLVSLQHGFESFVLGEIRGDFLDSPSSSVLPVLLSLPTQCPRWSVILRSTDEMNERQSQNRKYST